MKICQALDISQVDPVNSVGYALKYAQMALHQAIEARLRDRKLSLSQYACLELVAREPGLSNAQLAREAFVSRQAIHQLIPGLRRAGLISSRGEGRAQRHELTEQGRRQLDSASRTFRDIERKMLAGLDQKQRAELHRLLISCTDSLRTEE